MGQYLGRIEDDTAQALADAEQQLAALQRSREWELAKTAADAAGIVDPTPTSDAISLAMSVAEQDWVGHSSPASVSSPTWAMPLPNRSKWLAARRRSPPSSGRRQPSPNRSPIIRTPRSASSSAAWPPPPNVPAASKQPPSAMSVTPNAPVATASARNYQRLAAGAARRGIPAGRPTTVMYRWITRRAIPTFRPVIRHRFIAVAIRRAL